MKPIIYHTGLTPPPSIHIRDYKICYYPVLQVEYVSSNVPQDISDFLQLDPVVLMMSKNSVIGLNKWLFNFGLEPDFFADATFWTVGDKTHASLQNILDIKSFYPNEMTGNGVLQALQDQNHSRVLLISGQEPRLEFTGGLSLVGINFFHFAVYKTSCEKNTEFPIHFTNTESNYIIITSPSAVYGILKILALQDLSELHCRIISIGPTTSSVICQNGGNVFMQSSVQNIHTLYNDLDSLIVKSDCM